MGLTEHTEPATKCREGLASQGVHCSWIAFAHAMQRRAAELEIATIPDLSHPLVDEVLTKIRNEEELTAIMSADPDLHMLRAFVDAGFIDLAYYRKIRDAMP